MLSSHSKNKQFESNISTILSSFQYLITKLVIKNELRHENMYMYLNAKIKKFSNSDYAYFITKTRPFNKYTYFLNCKNLKFSSENF